MNYEEFRKQTLPHFGTFEVNKDSPLDEETQFLRWDNSNQWLELCRLWFQIHGTYGCRRVILNFQQHLVDNPELELQFDQYTSIKITCTNGFITRRCFHYSLNRKKRRRFGSEMSVKKIKLGPLSSYTVDVDVYVYVNVDVDVDVDVNSIYISIP